jgi:hypothetical protein
MKRGPPGRQEGQFDLGLVNRSKHGGIVRQHEIRPGMSIYQSGALLGQGALTFDYVFKRGRIGKPSVRRDSNTRKC